MKCFNHEDREAVATCQHCGKALCKACASKYTPCLCDECFQALQEEAHAQRVAAAEGRRQSRLEQKALPPGLDYTRIRGLRIEAAQKLAHIRPRTLGQASRISGVNPADISVLMIYLGIR